MTKKLVTNNELIWSHFVVLLKSDYNAEQSRGGFVEFLSCTQIAQQSVTKIISLEVVNLVTPKPGAKHELLFNKPASVSEVHLLKI